MNSPHKTIIIIDTSLEFDGHSIKASSNNRRLYVTSLGNPIETTEFRSEAVEFLSDSLDMNSLESVFKIYRNGAYSFESIIA